MFSKLWKRTKEIATTYTWTFVVVMVLNQLLFFGFCLNPVCLIAAMPHVLFITVVIGTWLEKSGDLHSDDISVKRVSKLTSNDSDSIDQPSCPRCGSRMILRTAKQGHYAGQKFWGCGDYPNCKGIVNL
jgi:predicted RNA-binding Zn-ribbon protein involved in translation (DUF1610 family)